MNGALLSSCDEATQRPRPRRPSVRSSPVLPMDVKQPDEGNPSGVGATSLPPSSANAWQRLGTNTMIGGAVQPQLEQCLYISALAEPRVCGLLTGNRPPPEHGSP